MKIAICDDEYIDREILVSLTEDYIAERKTEFEYAVFLSYLDMQNRIDEFDVFVLDYQMPDVNGLEFAAQIREKYGADSKAIVFVTSFDEIVYDAFVVRAHRFLTKPVVKEKYFEALDAYLHTSLSNRQIVIKGAGATSVLPLREIYYVQVAKKELYFCTENEQILCRRSIESAGQELEAYGFYRVHRSYLVNMRALSSFDRAHVEFPNGERVPISSRKYADFCKAYLEMK